MGALADIVEKEKNNKAIHNKIESHHFSSNKLILYDCIHAVKPKICYLLFTQKRVELSLSVNRIQTGQRNLVFPLQWNDK